MVADIASGFGSNPGALTALGNQLFFTAQTGKFGRELYVIDTANIATSHFDLTTGGGYRVEVDGRGQGVGQLIQGPSNAFDGLNRLQVNGLDFSSPANQSSLLDDGGTTLVYAVRRSSEH